MIITEQNKIGGLQVVVKGLGPILAVFEQLQGLSGILVNDRLLHWPPEI